MSVLLDVHPPGYAQAARTMGGEVAGSVTRARDELLSRLDGSGGMGGSDDVGTQWSTSYDDAAQAAVTGLTNLADSASCLAALLEQTAINYAGAEAASVPGEPAPLSERRWAASAAGPVAAPPSAAGTGVPEPVGWSLLQHEIGRVWPNGHQDLLHASASAWHATRTWLLSLVPDLDGAITEVMEQRGPEVGDATAVLNGLRRQLVDLADHLDAIGDACSGYAHDLDRAHSAILRECVSFVNTTIAAEAAGGVLCVVTLGASEVMAQGAVVLAASRAAQAIRAAVDALAGIAVGAALDLDLAASRLAALTADMRPTLARTVQESAAVRPGVAGQVAPVATTPVDAPFFRLEVASQHPVITRFASKAEARNSLSGPLRGPSREFFGGATGKCKDYQVIETADGTTRMEFFAPANNAGYGKLYVQILDASGRVRIHYKDTIGPGGVVIQRKWLEGRYE